MKKFRLKSEHATCLDFLKKTSLEWHQTKRGIRQKFYLAFIPLPCEGESYKALSLHIDSVKCPVYRISSK